MIVQFLGYHHLQEIYWRPEDKALDAAPVAKLLIGIGRSVLPSSMIPADFTADR